MFEKVKNDVAYIKDNFAAMVLPGAQLGWHISVLLGRLLCEAGVCFIDTGGMTMKAIFTSKAVMLFLDWGAELLKEFCTV